MDLPKEVGSITIYLNLPTPVAPIPERPQLTKPRKRSPALKNTMKRGPNYSSVKKKQPAFSKN